MFRYDRQQPKELAEAGFFYIGLSDQVKCFYCDGGLRNWQADDYPWTEHARWFSKCGFVRLVKGDDFIRECTAEDEGGAAGAGQDVPGCSRSSSASSLSTAVGPSQEAQIRTHMNSAIVQQALSMGVDASR